MSNVDTVKEMYAAFGRGDIDTIISKLDDGRVGCGYRARGRALAGVAKYQHITDTAMHWKMANGH